MYKYSHNIGYELKIQRPPPELQNTFVLVSLEKNTCEKTAEREYYKQFGLRYNQMTNQPACFTVTGA